MIDDGINSDCIVLAIAVIMLLELGSVHISICEVKFFCAKLFRAYCLYASLFVCCHRKFAEQEQYSSNIY